MIALAVVVNISDWSKKELNKSIIRVRIMTLLLFNLWEEESLYFLFFKLKKYNFEKKYLKKNIFKYSKYINVNERFIP